MDKIIKYLLTKAIIFSLALLAWNSSASSDSERSSVFPAWKKVDSSENLKPHIGLMLGFANPDGEFDTNEQIGVDLAYAPYIPLSLGAQITHSSFQDSDQRSDEFNRTALLARAAYNFGGSNIILKRTYVGVGAGALIESEEGEYQVGIGFAPFAGFDLPLDEVGLEKWSAGVFARYLTTSTGNLNAASAAATLKYWY